MTLLIALGGFGLAAVSLVLTVRRDRGTEKVGLNVAASIEGDKLVLRITNTERRAVTAERAGLAHSKTEPLRDAFRWDGINARVTAAMVHRDPPLPIRLEPGDPAYVVRASLYLVRNGTSPGKGTANAPKFAWAEDSYANIYWAQLEASVRTTIAATKRRVSGGQNSYGEPVFTDVEDTEDVALETLTRW